MAYGMPFHGMYIYTGLYSLGVIIINASGPVMGYRATTDHFQKVNGRSYGGKHYST